MKTIKNTIIYILILSIPLAYLIILIIHPEITKQSAFNGMIICSNIIIPTLFPFMVGALFINNSGILQVLSFSKDTTKNKYQIITFILSLVGGYPIGAKIISNEYSKGNISASSAEKLLLCCVNAGPSFIILTIGNGILGSVKLGLILFASHVIVSLIFLAFLSKKISFNIIAENKINIVDAFVNSVSDSACAMLNICAQIVFISTVLGVIEATNLPEIIKKFFGYTLEISNAVTKTNNVYIISALLGFGGISIFFQIASISSSYLKKPIKLLLSRIIHSILSTALTFIQMKTFKINIETISNISAISINHGKNSIIISIMLITTTAVLLYSLASKKYCGKISKDIF